MARAERTDGVDADRTDAGTRAPLWRQLADRLRDDIEHGRLAAGEQLPSEPALAAEAGVSRSVVRQALSELASDGLVRKGRGRRATVVAQPRYERYVSRSSGFHSQFQGRGIALETRVARAEVADLPDAAATFFGAEQGVVLDRVRSVGGVPVAYVRTFLPLAPCRALLDDDLTDRSLHEALATRFGLRVASGRRTVHAVAAPADIGGELDVTEGDPLLLLRSEGRDQAGRPLEWFQTWHPADRIAFEIQVLGDDEQVVEHFDAAAPALTDETLAASSGATATPATATPGMPAALAGSLAPAAPELPAVLVVAGDAAGVERLSAAGVAVAIDAAAAAEPYRPSDAVALVRDPADAAAWQGAVVLRTTGGGAGGDLDAEVVGTARELAAVAPAATTVVIEPAWQLGPAWARWVAQRRPDLAVIAWDVPPGDVAAHLEAGARHVVVVSDDLDAAISAATAAPGRAHR